MAAPSARALALAFAALALALLAPLAAAQQAFGSGVGGDVCGDTGLGFTSSLIAAVQGWGINYDTASNTSSIVAVVNNQIIYNHPVTPGCLKASCPIASKQVECVYNVSINYANSSLVIMTGPPGVRGIDAAQRCWNFATISTGSGGTTIMYNRGLYGSSPCPPTPLVASMATGTLGAGGAYSTMLPIGYGSSCDNSTGSSLAANLTAMGSGFWLQSNSLSFAPPGAGYANVTCLVGPGSVDSNNVIMMPAAAGGCFGLQVYPMSGALQFLMVPGPTCPVMFPTFASPNTVTVGVIFPNAMISASSAPPPPTTMQTVPVVQYNIRLTGLFTAIHLADPCAAVPMRIAAAATLGNGVTVASIVLTFIVDSMGVTLNLPLGSLANTLTSPPASCSGGTSSRRRLLREGVDFSVVTAATARALQSTTGTVGVQVQVPASVTNASTFAATVTSAPAPSTSGLPPNIGITEASSAGNATSTTATVAVPVVYPARINPYVVDPLITQFHNLPRVCLSMCQGTATNVFALNITYAQGAVGLAAGLFALAVISLVIYVPSYLCGLCACGSCRCRKQRDPEKIGNLCSPRTVFVVFGILNIGMILSTLVYLGRFPVGLQQLSDGLNQFGNTLTQAGNFMANPTCEYASNAVGPCPMMAVPNSAMMTYSVYASSVTAVAQVNNLTAVCNAASPPCPTAVTTILSAISSGESSAESLAGTLGTLLSTTGTLIDTELGSVNVALYKSYITMAGYIVLGALSGFIAIFTFFVCKSTCACCLHGISAPFTIVLSSLLMIIAGLFYVVGVIGADVCYDPYTTLLTLANQESPSLMSGMAGQTLTYYLTCGANPAEPVTGASSLIAGAVTTVQGAYAQVQSLQAQAADPANRPVLGALNTPALTALTAAMDDSSLATGGLQTLMSCATIDPIISELFTGLCTNGVATIIGIARILIAASVLLFLQLGVGIDMCCFHPGLTSRYLSEDQLAPAPMIIGKSKQVATDYGANEAGDEADFSGANPRGRGARM